MATNLQHIVRVGFSLCAVILGSTVTYTLIQPDVPIPHYDIELSSEDPLLYRSPELPEPVKIELLKQHIISLRSKNPTP